MASNTTARCCRCIYCTAPQSLNTKRTHHYGQIKCVVYIFRNRLCNTTLPINARTKSITFFLFIYEYARASVYSAHRLRSAHSTLADMRFSHPLRRSMRFFLLVWRSQHTQINRKSMIRMQRRRTSRQQMTKNRWKNWMHAKPYNGEHIFSVPKFDSFESIKFLSSTDIILLQLYMSRQVPVTARRWTWNLTWTILCVRVCAWDRREPAVLHLHFNVRIASIETMIYPHLILLLFRKSLRWHNQRYILMAIQWVLYVGIVWHHSLMKANNSWFSLLQNRREKERNKKNKNSNRFWRLLFDQMFPISPFGLRIFTNLYSQLQQLQVQLNWAVIFVKLENEKKYVILRAACTWARKVFSLFLSLLAAIISPSIPSI